MATVLARKVSIPLKGLRRRMRLGLVASLVTCQVGQSWSIYSETNAHNHNYGTSSGPVFRCSEVLAANWKTFPVEA